MKFLIPRIFYYLLYFPLKAVFKIFFSLQIQSREELRNLKGPLIIASSHASWADPFLVGIALPLSARTSPIHYATWWKYYYFPFFTPLIWLFGGFPVRKGIGLEKALAAGSGILQKDGVVGIFPTGKRTRKWNEQHQPRAKRGVAFLAVKNKVPVLPVKIEGNVGMRFGSFLRRKHRIRVKIGKAIFLPDYDLRNPENLNYPSNLIMDKIGEL
jgi:1-acyl-sn-glycerol-3-phosphate acyltransferase